ncbi:GreA/GreB family elongation factor [Anoxynatronum sibiricum]|uniref:GreA/GreB family elongation factor n=1 Tax=Anoxynatronum sibiricum TaxID=210623 RepID=A0ABU9VX23_9CLOT
MEHTLVMSKDEVGQLMHCYEAILSRHYFNKNLENDTTTFEGLSVFERYMKSMWLMMQSFSLKITTQEVLDSCTITEAVKETYDELIGAKADFFSAYTFWLKQCYVRGFFKQYEDDLMYELLAGDADKHEVPAQVIMTSIQILKQYIHLYGQISMDKSFSKPLTKGESNQDNPLVDIIYSKVYEAQQNHGDISLEGITITLEKSQERSANTDFPSFPQVALELYHKLNCLLGEADETQASVNVGDIVTLKKFADSENRNLFEIERFVLVEEWDGILHEMEDNLLKVTMSSPLGKKLFRSSVGDVIEYSAVNGIDYSYKILDIHRDEKARITLEITLDEWLNTWVDDHNYQSGFSYSGQRARQEETRLYKTGYKIWEKGTRLSDEERWYRLMNHAIPKLGIKEVSETINSHIHYLAAGNDQAVERWKDDLEKLKQKYYRKDKVGYFD